MRPEIDEQLRRAGGVATRSRLLRTVGRHQLDHEVRTGRLVRPFPRAHCRPWDADFALERAALTSVGPPVGLSHLSALHGWELLESAPAAVHVSVAATRCPRRHEGLVVHRVARLPPLVWRNGLPTVPIEEAITSSWPMIASRDRRSPAIIAVRNRLTTPSLLRAAVARHPRLAGRRELLHLLELLAAGCESELEIWGLLGVFDVPGLTHGARQHWVRTPKGWVRLDLAYVAERVDVELDGHAFHSSRARREADMRRDARLAALGWVTLRFSYDRLHDDVEGCRRDTLAVLAGRRP